MPAWSDWKSRWAGYKPTTKKPAVKKPRTVMGSTGGIAQDQELWNRFTAATGATPQNATRSAARGWDLENWDILSGGIGLQPTTPAGPSGPGGPGGGGRGGGGGGGGGSAITQAMIDAMARALGAQGPQLSMPAFQGQALGAFNAQPYTQALGQIDQAVAADQANIAANQQAVAQQLQQNYANPYATAQVTQGPVQQTIGAGLTGGQANPAAAQQVNNANAGDQAAFQNLLQVLAAADQQSQNSRMAQVGMDANYGRQNLGAQALGMRGGVNTAQAQAQNQWQQQAAERDYQNNLMRQQWEREQAMTNYQTNTAAQTARLQPILDLIAQSGGTSGLNFNSLFAALGIQ